MRKYFLFVLGLILFISCSCTKSGSLTGGGSAGSGSYGGGLTGSVNGGLSPAVGSLINLYVLGSANPIASATTNSSGGFSLNFTAPGGGNLLYVQATGGNAGHGTNGNLQMFALLGAANSLPSSITMNELTTVAFVNAMSFYGFMTDSNGIISFTASPGPSDASNSAAQSSVLAQYNNFIANGTVNTALSSGNQLILNAGGNAIAGCIENTSNCSTLFSTAQSSTSGAAKSITDAVINFINLPNNASNGYTLGVSNSAATGFSMQSSMPSGFSFSLPPVVTANDISVASHPFAVAVDSSGNVWISNNGPSVATKLSPSGNILGTFSVGAAPVGIAIDQTGNVWLMSNNCGCLTELDSSGTRLASIVLPGGGTDGGQGIAIDSAENLWIPRPANNTVVKLNASGTVIGTYSIGNQPTGIAIDSVGNVWTPNFGDGTVNKQNSSGVNLGTFSSTGGNGYAVAVDPSGNIWTTNFASTPSVGKLNSSGALLGTFTVGSTSSRGIAADAAGNIWISSTNGTASKLNSMGTVLATYSIGNSALYGITFDASGNLWIADYFNNRVVQLPGATIGPTFFTYSGPIAPYTNF